MPTQDDVKETGARLRKLVEGEAAAAENEGEVKTDEPVDEPVDEPAAEPVDEPAAEQVDEGLSMEAQAERLGELMDGFEAGLRELFGVAEPLVPVPMDGALGFMLPGALELKPHAKFRRCSTCNGHGVVVTGSLADGKQTADCPRCAGRGYLEKLDELNENAATSETAGNGATDDDAGYGVPKWMGDPGVGQS